MAHGAAGGKGVLVLDGDDLVVDLGVEDVGHKAGADTLDLVRACLALGEHRGGGGLDGDDLNLGVLLLEELAHAGHGAAGANAGDEDVDLAVGVIPDLGAGRGLVDGRVRGVHKLAGEYAVGGLLLQLLGLGDSALHALGAVGEHELRTVCLHQLAALDGHGLGHGDDHLVAASRRHRGDADAGVAARGLDDGVVTAAHELACLLGLVNHVLGDAVFNGPGGVEVFQLDEHAGLEVLIGLKVGELQERGVADKLIDGRVNLAHDEPPKCSNDWIPCGFTVRLAAKPINLIGCSFSCWEA